MTRGEEWQEGKVHEENDGLRALAGVRPAPLSEVAGPQAAVTVGHVAAGPPSLVVVLVAVHDHVDQASVQFLLQQSLLARASEEGKGEGGGRGEDAGGRRGGQGEPAAGGAVQGPGRCPASLEQFLWHRQGRRALAHDLAQGQEEEGKQEEEKGGGGRSCRKPPPHCFDLFLALFAPVVLPGVRYLGVA